MNIIQKKIDDLLPAVYNPRKDLTPEDKEYQKIKRSIEEFGYVEPIIYNVTTGTIVGGHQRLKVLKELGYTEIDVVEIEETPEREKALNIALNKIEGEWDKDTLKDLLQELDTGEIDMDITGFDELELERLMGEVHQFEYNVEEVNTDYEEEKQESIPVRIGMYNFDFSYEEWEEIIAYIRINCGFVKENVVAELKRRLIEGEL